VGEDVLTSHAERRANSGNGGVRTLVERAQRGDRAALEDLYLIHFDRIYSYLHMSVGSRHDAEDLTTQTFVKMLESIGRFRWQAVPGAAGTRRRRSRSRAAPRRPPRRSRRSPRSARPV
jgi:hypothetical protein